MIYRGKRLRGSPGMRDLVRETALSGRRMIMPYFVMDTDDRDFQNPIGAMPGQFQLSPARLEERVGKAVEAGLNAVLLFGLPREKNPEGSAAWQEDGVIQRAVRRLKASFPHLLVVTDVCLCEYTSHGHCGLVDPDGRIRNDETCALIARTALSHAAAGADMVAPSDMMDGRVAAIRETLDQNGYQEIPVMSYAVKYASAFYGPFREAAGSAPQFGDRKTYQMDPPNSRDALREALADEAEGADILIVKPAGPYLDIVREVRDLITLPVAAYQVSGEYSMIMAASQKGWLDRDRVVMESLLGIRRAGADIIISYFTEDLLLRGLL